MKKLILTMTALSVMSVTHAATLDVKGEIKIDGKVVFDQQGKLVSPNLIDINAYIKSPKGIAILTATNIEGQEHTIVLTDDGMKNSSEFDYNNGELEWAGEWFDGELNRIQNSWDKCSPTRTTEALQNIPYPSLKIGNTGSNFAKYKVYAKNSCETDADKNETVQDIESISLLAKLNYQQGQFNFDDCILVEQTRSWGRVDLKTFCLGQGLVEYKTDYRNNEKSASREYKLTSIEMLPDDYTWEHKILTLNTEEEINSGNAKLEALLSGKTLYVIDTDNESGTRSVESISFNINGSVTDTVETGSWKVENGLLLTSWPPSPEDVEQEADNVKDRLTEVTNDYIVLEEITMSQEETDGPFRVYFEQSKAEAYMATLPTPETPVIEMPY
ncbi:hypothetical protein CW745_06910 [Psychromonas sp. psych-6C06]|uniref:hypothetical protein n=1 Tax=Psychromonas sp. psych-6C06 TaxID=2058089 RepID=UPI000C342541|nr:hypothetical protein [Psychromonas sp. psych-6C06]PKF63141.1 hypothetical protein CW745_06910 [Psychromonas sp. psych-6C06]